MSQKSFSFTKTWLPKQYSNASYNLVLIVVPTILSVEIKKGNLSKNKENSDIEKS